MVEKGEVADAGKTQMFNDVKSTLLRQANTPSARWQKGIHSWIIDSRSRTNGKSTKC